MRLVLATAKAPHNKRVIFAMSTWVGKYEMKEIECTRTAANIGCNRGCYYVKDVFDHALKLEPNDVFVYVNNDVALVPEWPEIIVPAVQTHGCAFAQRIDVIRFDRLLKLADLLKAKSYPGIDLFAFTSVWWFAHRDNFPDVVLGYEGWDFVAQWQMRASGFPGNLPPLCYHELHQAYWAQNRNLRIHPVQLVNRETCRQWAIAAGAQDWIADSIYCPFLFCSPSTNKNLSTSAGSRQKNLSTSAEIF